MNFTVISDGGAEPWVLEENCMKRIAVNCFSILFLIELVIGQFGFWIAAKYSFQVFNFKFIRSIFEEISNLVKVSF